MGRRFALGPVAVGIVAAIGAVALGCFYLLVADAPMRMLLMNAAALLIGIAAMMLLRWATRLRVHGGQVLLLSALAIVATALFGASVDNVSRWVSVAGVTVQPALLLVPAIAVGFAARPSRWSTAAVMVAAVGVALQPDRAIAGALLAAIAATVAVRREPLRLTALIAAAIAFMIAMLRPDTLPPVPFVEGVLHHSFVVSPWAGLAVLAGCALLLAPLLHLPNRAMRPRLLAFGAVWAAIVAAAAIGNYPTPLVGFGASAIVGYLLSVAMLSALPRR